jgi:hypothetical protein
MNGNEVMQVATQSSGRSANLKPWAKGQSGNPGGTTAERRQAIAVVNNFLAERSLYAAQKLVGLLESDDERIVFMSAKEVLAYGIGVPQKIEIDPENKGVTVTLRDFELEQRLAEAERKLAEQSQPVTISVRTDLTENDEQS